MKHSIIFETDAIYIAIFLFLAMAIILSVGYNIGKKSEQAGPADSGVLGSMIGLLALLLAFTFGMAGSRFETRKNNLIEEVNRIGTAILRSDIYPDTSRVAFRKDFERYLDARILYFKSKRNDSIINSALAKSNAVEVKLWKRAAFYGRKREYLVQSNMMLPALNSMFDIASTTNALFNSTIPETIVYLLLAFSTIISFYVGFNAGFKKQIDKIYLIGFCLLTSIVVYTIMDLDRPRRGIINIKNEITLFEELKTNFK